MPNQEPMIKVQDVRFRYDPEQPKYAVDGVSLDIRRGEFVAVLGANGCGKSTLAKHFNAILLPEAGTVLVEGMDTRNEDHLYDVRQKVGMVFQNPDNQIVATIVEEDVAFAPENLGVPPEEIRTRIDEAMKLAGIYEKREAAPYKLSGGRRFSHHGIAPVRYRRSSISAAGRFASENTVRRFHTALGSARSAAPQRSQSVQSCNSFQRSSSGQSRESGCSAALGGRYIPCSGGMPLSRIPPSQGAAGAAHRSALPRPNGKQIAGAA